MLRNLIAIQPNILSTLQRIFLIEIAGSLRIIDTGSVKTVGWDLKNPQAFLKPPQKMIALSLDIQNLKYFSRTR